MFGMNDKIDKVKMKKAQEARIKQLRVIDDLVIKMRDERLILADLDRKVNAIKYKAQSRVNKEIEDKRLAEVYKRELKTANKFTRMLVSSKSSFCDFHSEIVPIYQEYLKCYVEHGMVNYSEKAILETLDKAFEREDHEGNISFGVNGSLLQRMATIIDNERYKDNKDTRWINELSKRRLLSDENKAIDILENVNRPETTWGI